MNARIWIRISITIIIHFGIVVLAWNIDRQLGLLLLTGIVIGSGIADVIEAW